MRFAEPAQAQRLLALDHQPRYRVGPIPDDEMPAFDVCGPQRIEPAGGQPGGGIEVCTTSEIFMFGFFGFEEDGWVL
jgi:hypothetical protein